MSPFHLERRHALGQRWHLTRAAGAASCGRRPQRASWSISLANAHVTACGVQRRVEATDAGEQVARR